MLFEVSPALSRRRHCYASTLEAYRAAFDTVAPLLPLFPPTVQDVDPRRGLACAHATPFLSKEAGALPHGPPDCVAELIAHYLVSGASRAPPNVDVDFETVQLASNGEARRVLAQAAADGRTFWAAVHVPAVEHPLWWPAGRGAVGGGRVGSQEGAGRSGRATAVPGFEHMIVGSGAAGIGMHRDRYVGDLAGARPAAEGAKANNERLVSTYLALGRGRKHVVLLPPTAEGARLAQSLGGDGCDEAYGRRESQRAKLPARPSPEVLEAVLAAGGYWFDLEASADATKADDADADASNADAEDKSDGADTKTAVDGIAPAITAVGVNDESRSSSSSAEEEEEEDEFEEVEPLCLFIPAGWWHWLAGDSAWHVAWSGSFFPAPAPGPAGTPQRGVLRGGSGAARGRGGGRRMRGRGRAASAG